MMFRDQSVALELIRVVDCAFVSTFEVLLHRAALFEVLNVKYFISGTAV